MSNETDTIEDTVVDQEMNPEDTSLTSVAASLIMTAAAAAVGVVATRKFMNWRERRAVKALEPPTIEVTSREV